MKFTKPHERITVADSVGKELIAVVVDQFYDAVKTHPTLSAPFSSVKNWHHHKDRITEFWWTALGGKPVASHSYDPVGKHFASGFNADWKALFLEILNQNLPENLAQNWYQRVEMIGSNLVRQNERLKNSPPNC
jgi:hemoglobin